MGLNIVPGTIGKRVAGFDLPPKDFPSKWVVKVYMWRHAEIGRREGITGTRGRDGKLRSAIPSPRLVRRRPQRDPRAAGGQFLVSKINLTCMIKYNQLK